MGLNHHLLPFGYKNWLSVWESISGHIVDNLNSEFVFFQDKHISLIEIKNNLINELIENKLTAEEVKFIITCICFASSENEETDALSRKLWSLVK